jgi:photosystem II stability/assembly factor-like uncharacterized protein
MSRNRPIAAAGVVLAVAAVAVPGVSAVQAFDPPCTSFAISPAFVTDRTAACTYTVDTSKGVHELRLAMTRDGARSWRAVAATGLTTQRNQIASFVPVFSPQFATDRTIMIGTDTGLHVSRDAGETWTVVDPTVHSGSRTNPAPFFATPVARAEGEPLRGVRRR